MELGLSLLGLGITFAAFIFAWVWQHVNTANNKVIKELTTETRNLILEGDHQTRNLILEGDRQTKSLILEESRNNRESTEKLIEKISRMINEIGQLIVADGERTREIIREIKQR